MTEIESAGRSALRDVECSACGAIARADVLLGVCPRCCGVLLARYDLELAARTLRPEAAARRARGVWRWGELLPPSPDPVTLGEGSTPLIEAPRLARDVGVDRLYIKDESSNPTGSFKARGMAVAVTRARDLGVHRIALPSAGNAGGAAAAYAARAGLAVDLFLPQDTPAPFRLEAEAFGARVHLVVGTIADCGVRVRALAAEHGWFDLSTLREPWRLEGKKTLGFELAEGFSGELPDVVVYPTGGGTGLIGMWKAFAELEAIGWIDSRRPRMVVVQAAGCAPIVRAFERGDASAEPWRGPATYASGLRVPAAIGDRLILQAVRESGGTAVAVTDEAMAEAQLVLARNAGVFAAPEGGATLAAVRELAARGELRRSDRVVLFNTGTGLKYPDIPGVHVA